ncbi:MAG: hypothetical protein P1U58_08055 [Verrucomicrobiales bacterium]|nr:hypothetical protein [Verrucomicrobiales bacterium]
MSLHSSGFNFRILAETQGDPPIWLIVLIPVLFAIVFPAFWCFVIWILSQVSGWKRLAARYRTSEQPQGGTYHGLFGMVGLVSYRGTLNVTTAEEGFFLAPNALFRFGHATLFIPWSECQLVRQTSFFGTKSAKIQIGDPRVGTLSIPLRVFEETAGRTLLEASP